MASSRIASGAHADRDTNRAAEPPDAAAGEPAERRTVLELDRSLASRAGGRQGPPDRIARS